MAALGYTASIFMGLSLGLIGGGGSILTVPILVYLFLMDPLTATSTSLFIVGSTALVGALLALRQDKVEIKTGVLFATPSFVGVYFTKSFLVPWIPADLGTIANFHLTKPLLIMGIFALLMLLASLAMIRGKTTPLELTANKKSWMSIAVQGFFVGCVTGLVGAGGGFLIVPALVNLVGLNMRKAIGTSLAIIAANSLFGFTVALARGLAVNWSVVWAVLGCSVIGLFIGSLLSKKVPEQKLKTGFGYFVLIMGTLILLDQIRHL